MSENEQKAVMEEGETVRIQFTLGIRLRNAIDQRGRHYISEGIHLLVENPDRIVMENIGIDDEPATALLALSIKDLAAVDKLVVDRGVVGRSVIIRNAIEALIDKYEQLEIYKKPEGWQGKPLALAQGGANPVPPLEEPAEKDAICIPLYLWNQISHYDRGRGHAHEKDGVSLNRFLREAIDNIDTSVLPHHYEPNIRVQDAQTVKSVSIQIFARQMLLVKAIANRNRWSRSETISAIVRAELFRTGELQPIGEPFVERYWNTLVKHNGDMFAACSELGVLPEYFSEELEAANCLKFNGERPSSLFSYHYQGCLSF